MYLYAKLGIIFEIDNYFYSFFQNKRFNFDSCNIFETVKHLSLCNIAIPFHNT